MGTKPKKIPKDKRFPIQIEDLTDFTDAWSDMDRDEKAGYSDDQFTFYFYPEVDVDDLDVWFSEKNAKNLTHDWLGGDAWELLELVHEENLQAPPGPSPLVTKLAEHGFLEMTPTLTDDAGKIERFSWLNKTELAPLCEPHLVNKSLKKNEIIEALVAAGAEPPPAYIYTKSSTFESIIEENLARYVTAVGENMKRFPEIYWSTIVCEVKIHLNAWMKNPDSFIAQHIGVSVPGAMEQECESAMADKEKNEIRALKEEVSELNFDNADETGQGGVDSKLVVAALVIAFIMFLVL